MKLWTGQAISELGSGLTGTALQLIAALSLGATPLQMGVLAALSAVPVLGLALFAGVWIDRLRRRPVMIAADLGRAALLLSIPVATALGVMRLSHLFVIMPMVSVLSVFFDTAYQSFLPTLVARDQLMEANSKLGAARAGAEIMAPGLGGLLVQAIGGPSTMLLDALSFLSSAVLVGLMRTPEAPPALSREQERLGLAIREGLRALLERPLFRTFAVSTLVSSFFGNFFAGLYTLYVVRVLGFGPVVLGVAVGCGGLGSLAGALLAARLTRRFGGGPVAAYAAAVCGLSGLFIPLAGGPPAGGGSSADGNPVRGRRCWHRIRHCSLEPAAGRDASPRDGPRECGDEFAG